MTLLRPKGYAGQAGQVWGLNIFAEKQDFREIYEICGQNFTNKIIDRRLFVEYNVSRICVKTYKYGPETSAKTDGFGIMAGL
jgi:hypothetical protein